MACNMPLWRAAIPNLVAIPLLFLMGVLWVKFRGGRVLSPNLRPSANAINCQRIEFKSKLLFVLLSFVITIYFLFSPLLLSFFYLLFLSSPCLFFFTSFCFSLKSFFLLFNSFLLYCLSTIISCSLFTSVPNSSLLLPIFHSPPISSTQELNPVY